AFRAELVKMWDEETKEEIQVAPHPHQIVRIPLEISVKPYTLVRRFAGDKPKETQR
ncbi:MAG: U32 family peptidase C-terminal domain-containing protein, partial [Clostridia bacterium]|nr:U32 family peptidase C-terminal domain-containing protein [Clostridia bacterium]